MIVNCNDLWTRLVNAVAAVRRRPVVTNRVPPAKRRG